jgi:hypothetical protein
MPGMLPLDEPSVLAELGRYLPEGWDAVVHADIDGPTCLPLRIDQAHKNLGRYSAARRTARAVYLASAPGATNNKGVDLKNILLAVAQPGEAVGTFSDALARMSGEATYLYVNGSQYWYNTRPNVTRLANDRANSNFTDHDADNEIKSRLQKQRGGGGAFAVTHVFPDGPGDVLDDDDGVHLVILSSDHSHIANTNDSPAIKIAEQIVAQRNAGPRMNQNLLVFVAPTQARVSDIRGAARTYLAWKSVIEDQKSLNLAPIDMDLAGTKLEESTRTLNQRIDDAYQAILVPTKKPGDATVDWHVTKPSGSGSLPDRIATKLESEEKLITRYSGTRVRMDLDKIPLWSDSKDIKITDLWAAYCRFPYLPRLASKEVLIHAVRDAVQKLNWDVDGFAYAEVKEGSDYRGLVAPGQPLISPSGWLVHPETAAPLLAPKPVSPGPGPHPMPDPEPGPGPMPKPGQQGTAPKTRFYASFKLDEVRGVAQLGDILTDIVNHLKAAPGTQVTLELEVRAANEAGFNVQTVRIVTENSRARGSTNADFEA